MDLDPQDEIYYSDGITKLREKLDLLFVKSKFPIARIIELLSQEGFVIFQDLLS